MYSQKMMHYILGGKPGTKVAKPDVARDVERMFSPEAYEKQFLRDRKRVVSAEFDLTGAHWSGVGYQPVRNAGEHGAEQEFDTITKIVEEVLEDLVILKEGNADVVEKICLVTEVHTTQTIEAVAANTSELIIMKMDIKTTLWFESLMSKAGDVDWRIVKLNIDILNQQRIK
ncbi:hypothetical protein PRIC2_011596 [Phytophthora ramorum]